MPFNVEQRKKGGDTGWDVGEIDQATIDTAVELVAAAAAYFFPATPSLIPALWPLPDTVPSIRELDFGHVEPGTVELQKLYASQNWLDVDRLVWHLKNPGKTAHDNPYTSMPLVMSTDGNPVIVDGHHRLAALLLLGVDEVPVWMLPAPSQPQE